MQFSANLGFLWTELPLPAAIRAAARAGFAAVECHWPYQVPVADVMAALAETGLPMLGLNTARGAHGEFGLAALPGRQAEARAAIDEALAYAAATGTRAVHVMAGKAEGAGARAAFVTNLRHAALAAPDRTILIEPLNPRDVPGYFLNTTAQARAIIEELALPNVKLMFDCYHVQISEGDLCQRLTTLLPLIGHIQIAAVPSRAEPDRGEVDYRFVLDHIAGLGWQMPVGAEYRPAAGTEAGLGWIGKLSGGPEPS